MRCLLTIDVSERDDGSVVIEFSAPNNSLLERLKRYRDSDECVAKALINDAIKEIEWTRGTIQFLHSMSARQSTVEDL